MKNQLPSVFISIFVVLIYTLILPGANAQISLDGTVGPAGALSGPHYEIRADMGKQAGSNLFHSFSQFNIHTDESAAFSGPDTVSNIISRVTGGGKSWIDGTLRSTIPGANLYFLNPAGVMFGPNASLDIGGSFHVSTADYLCFKDGAHFDALQPENSLLTASPPAAFGFLNNHPADIAIEAGLSVPETETLSVVGGDVNITAGGFLSARSGQVNVISAASPGEAVFTDAGFDISAFEKQGNISFSRGSGVTVSSIEDNPSGQVFIRGGSFLIADKGSAVLSKNIKGDGGGIDIQVSGEMIISDGAQIATEAKRESNSGDIVLNAGIIEINRGGGIYALAQSRGKSGNIEISTTVLNIGDNSLIFNGSLGTGRSGDILVEADRVNMTNIGVFSTDSDSPDKGGDISVTARESLTISSSSALSAVNRQSGNSGNISIETKNLTVSENGFLNSGTEGTGRGGDITIKADNVDIVKGYVSSGNMKTDADTGHCGNISITAKNTVNIAGSGTDENGPYGKYYGLGSKNYGATDGGSISIFADVLNISKDGWVNCQTNGAGKGGNIDIEVNRLEVHEGGTITASTRCTGDSGDISITANKSVNVSGGGAKQPNSWIYTATHSSGNGGELSISTPLLTVGKNGVVYADTLGDENLCNTTGPDGRGGNIFIDGDRIELTDGGTVSSGTKTQGKGGNIEIQAKQLAISGDGSVSARSLGTGNAGDIFITADDSVQMKDSAVTTQAESADGGNIAVKAQSIIHLKDSEITAEVGGGKGDGGNISIDPEFVILDKSRIIADAHEGNGGNIHIVADQFIRSANSRVSASSRLGIEGTVEIESSETDIGSLSVLPADFFDATRWLKTPCSERFGQNMSRLVFGARDALPTQHDDWLASPPFHFDHLSCHLERSEKSNLQAVSNGYEFYYKGDFANAVRSLESALPDLDKQGKAYLHALLYLASAYQSLGYHQKALALLQSSADDAKKTDDPYRDALVFGTLGDIYLSLGNAEKAETYFKKGLIAAELSEKPELIANLLNHKGNFLSRDEDYEGASAAYRKSLEMIRQSESSAQNLQPSSFPRSAWECSPDAPRPPLNRNRRNGAETGGAWERSQVRNSYLKELKSKILLNTAHLKFVKEDYKGAADDIDKAMNQIESLPESHHQSSDFISLALLARKIAASYLPAEEHLGTLIREALQRAKQIAENLNDVRNLSYSYGYLGQCFETKENGGSAAIRLTRKALFFAQQGNCPEILYRWQQQLGRLFQHSGDIGKALIVYSEAVATLQPIRKEFFSGYRSRKDAFYEDVKPVYLGLTELLLKKADAAGNDKERQAGLKAAVNTMELLKAAELENYFEDECVAVKPEKIIEPDHVPPHTALIYPILFSDHLTLLVMLPGGIKQINVPADAEHIRKIASQFRERLQGISKMNRILYYAEPLYDFLIRPLESQLNAEETDTLIIAPDGALRMIPFTALYDGNQFLIEKYAVVTVPGITMTDADPIRLENTGVLLNGLSEGVQGFKALPGVENEFKEIRKIMEHGEILLNKAFTSDNLFHQFKNYNYSVVLMATHGVFGGSPRDTFLLTYNGKLNMNQMEDLIGLGKFRDRQIELLTLSACQTALGDERAALGLVGVALKAGVKSAIATLWSVYDGSASLIITEFYRQLGTPGISKAKALQKAQKKFLSQKEYAHPAYWAPFLLIGNWS